MEIFHYVAHLVACSREPSVCRLANSYSWFYVVVYSMVFKICFLTSENKIHSSMLSFSGSPYILFVYTGFVLKGDLKWVGA